MSAVLWYLASGPLEWFNVQFGVRTAQVWEYPDQSGWFQVVHVSCFAQAELKPAESQETPAQPRVSVEVPCHVLYRFGRLVPPDEVEADYRLRQEAS